MNAAQIIALINATAAVTEAVVGLAQQVSSVADETDLGKINAALDAMRGKYEGDFQRVDAELTDAATQPASPGKGKSAS